MHIHYCAYAWRCQGGSRSRIRIRCQMDLRSPCVALGVTMIHSSLTNDSSAPYATMITAAASTSRLIVLAILANSSSVEFPHSSRVVKKPPLGQIGTGHSG